LSLMVAAPIRTAAQHFVQPDAWFESQVPDVVPSLVHSTRFVPLPTEGQTGVSQAALPHERSHLQAAAQLSVAHAPVPEQVTSHVELLLHVMSLHALSPVQWIVHFQPLGHVTLPQLSALVHSAMHIRLPSSQVVQSFGQLDTIQ
jgi:hypothetical protein